MRNKPTCHQVSTNTPNQPNLNERTIRLKIDIKKSIQNTLEMCMKEHEETIQLNSDKVSVLMIDVILARTEEESIHHGARPGDFDKCLRSGVLPLCAASELCYGRIRPLIYKQNISLKKKISLFRMVCTLHRKSSPGDAIVIFNGANIPGYELINVITMKNN